MWKTLAFAVFICAAAAAMPQIVRAQATSTDAKAAEELAQQAFDAYQKGEFGSAIVLYKKAYQASAAGVILFNIANIYDKKLKDKDQALEYYRKYLRSGDTEPELVKRASERIDTVRAEIEASKQSQADERNASANPGARSTGAGGTTSLAVSKPPPPPRVPFTRSEKFGLLAGGLGVAGLAVSGTFGYLAMQQNDKANKGCNGTSSCPDDFGLSAHNAAKRDALISTVSFGIGAALVATGVVLYVYGPSKKEDKKEDRKTTIGIVPQFGGLAITGAWQ